MPQAKKYVADLGLTFEAIAKLPEIRGRAKQRISATFELELAISQEPRKIYKIEIASYVLAILYVAGIGVNSLTERFALFEAQKINSYLKLERKNDVVFNVAKAFAWDIHTNDDGSISIPFTKFLNASTRGRLFHDPKWKLVNRALENGLVRVTPFELARLLQEDVKQQIEKRAKQEIGKGPEEIQQDIEELKTEFLKRKPTIRGSPPSNKSPRI